MQFAPQVAVATADELEAADCAGKVLLVHGELTASSSSQTRSPFWCSRSTSVSWSAAPANAPAAILAATGSNPGFAGGLCPFPWIEDGTFEIPRHSVTRACCRNC
jgi:aminopeptidase YwaD